jgi:carboxylate-amine ligase
MAEYGLFSVTGVEIELMIVDRDTLAVRPLADRLLEAAAGAPASDVERGAMAWSNELVNHVVELKTNGPAASLEGLAAAFHAEVRAANALLEPMGALLLPGGAHPTMDPFRETVLWPHEHREIYRLYDRLFDCRGHGWANLQSTHVNLPFRGNAEFGALHAAIRALLPILPALTASTPILDGRETGIEDARLDVYRRNQRRFPEIAGQVIPEAVFTRADYDRVVFAPIERAIRPHDPEGILDRYFLNSRGAIARFDRGAIEIRTIDQQEGPTADLAFVDLCRVVLQGLVEGLWGDPARQRDLGTSALAALWRATVHHGADAAVTDPDYRALWGERRSPTAGALWDRILERVGDRLLPASRAHLALVREHGSLSRRLRRAAAAEGIPAAWRRLAGCLAEDRPFLPS